MSTTSKIHLQIDGLESVAWISEILHRHQSMVKVSFKNGYENIFYTDVETGKWIEEDLGFTSLAVEVGNKVKDLTRRPLHVPKYINWHKQVVDNKLIHFGFIHVVNGREQFFQVYGSNKKYLYTLVWIQQEEWQLLGHSDTMIHTLDIIMMHKIIHILSSYVGRESDF